MAQPGNNGNNKVFCVYPFSHINIDINGSIRLCCRAVEALQPRSPLTSEHANIYRDSLVHVWGSPGLEQIRQNMLENVPTAACQNCYDQEAVSSSSLRTMANTVFAENRGFSTTADVIDHCRNLQHASRYPLRSAHLWLSDSCNFRCRICSASFSTAIQRDRLHSSFRPATLNFPAENRFDCDKWGNADSVIDEILQISDGQLERLVFAGGEPLTNKGMLTILEAIIARRMAEQVTVKFNSNASILTERILQIFSHFKRVDVNLSIDGTGALNDYIRKGSSWSTVIDQIDRYSRQENCNLAIHPTVCLYNIFGLTDLLRFGEERNIQCVIENFLVNPPFLSIKTLPPAALREAGQQVKKAAVEAKARGAYVYNYNNILSFIEDALTNNTFADYFDDFVTFNQALDSDRKESLALAEPRLYSCIQEEYRQRSTEKPAGSWKEIVGRFKNRFLGTNRG